MTPLDRLLAEDVPTRPAPAPKPSTEPWTPEEQAEHLRILNEAISGWHWEGDTSLSAKRRHLRLIRRADAA